LVGAKCHVSRLMVLVASLICRTRSRLWRQQAGVATACSRSVVAPAVRILLIDTISRSARPPTFRSRRHAGVAGRVAGRRMRPIPPGADHLAGVRIAGFTPNADVPGRTAGPLRPADRPGAQRRNGRCSAGDGELCGLAVFEVGPRGHSRSTSTPGAVVVDRPVVGPANVHLLPVHSDGTSCVLTVCTERPVSGRGRWRRRRPPG
jgi:hypothetical protein